MSKAKVIITVQGGVVEVCNDDSAVDVLLVDYDNAEMMPLGELHALLEEAENFEAPEFVDELAGIVSELKELIQQVKDNED
jgi:hypothetical protein